jgi:hypothetical protein
MSRKASGDEEDKRLVKHLVVSCAHALLMRRARPHAFVEGGRAFLEGGRGTREGCAWPAADGGRAGGRRLVAQSQVKE